MNKELTICLIYKNSIDRAKLEMERITTTHNVNQVALMTSTLTKSLVFSPPGETSSRGLHEPQIAVLLQL